MSKYTLRRKDKGYISYVYRTGFKARVKVNYPKYFDDLMKYADADIDDIETEEDIRNLFKKAKSRGADFHESEDSRQAAITEWKARGYLSKKDEETEQEYRDKQVAKLLKSKRDRKVYRKTVIKRYGRGKPVKYEQYTVLFKVFKK